MTPLGDEGSTTELTSPPPTEKGGGWGAPLALLGFVLAASIFRSDVLIGVPYLVLLLVFRGRGIWAWAAGAGLAWLGTRGIGMDPGLWYMELSWALVVAGWFATLSLWWTDRSVLERGVGAVAGAFTSFAAFLLLRPSVWAMIDSRIGDRMRGTTAEVLAELALVLERDLDPEFVEGVMEMVSVQIELFPAVLGLCSLAALGLAWWMFGRWGRGWSRPLGPLKEFRFSDHLVWALIAGLAISLAGLGPAWERLGSNALLFMGTLYAVRGAAVILFIAGGVSVFGALGLVFAVVFLAPLVAAGLLVIGVGDTWLDLREKARTTST